MVLLQFWDRPDISKHFPDSVRVFPICPFPLCPPLGSTYKEHFRKGPRHNQDRFRKEVILRNVAKRVENIKAQVLLVNDWRETVFQAKRPDSRLRNAQEVPAYGFVYSENLEKAVAVSEEKEYPGAFSEAGPIF